MRRFKDHPSNKYRKIKHAYSASLHRRRTAKHLEDKWKNIIKKRGESWSKPVSDKNIGKPRRQKCTVRPVFEAIETGNTFEVKWPGVNINTVSIISVTKINPPTYELSYLDGSRWDIATASDVKPKSSSSTIQPGDHIMARWKDEKGFHRARVTMVHNDPRNLCEVRATGLNVDDNSETVLLSSEALQLMRVVDARGAGEAGS